MQGATLLSRGRRWLGYFWRPLHSRIEQQLTQGDENDDADERGATPQRTTRGVGLPAGEPVTRNGPLQPPSDPPAAC